MKGFPYFSYCVYVNTQVFLSVNFSLILICKQVLLRM